MMSVKKSYTRCYMGKSPVPSGTMVKYITRSGHKGKKTLTDDLAWGRCGHGCDILYYKIVFKFKAGQRVSKIKGYPFPGVIVASYLSLQGKERYVVECTIPEVDGIQHIFAPGQLELMGETS